MRKKYCSLLLLLILGCFPRLCAQQGDFEKGWYVTQQNDTLQGFILTGKGNFNAFYFKKSAMAPVSQVFMSAVKSLNVDEQSYVQWYGRRNMEYIDRVDLSLIKNDGVFLADTILLKRLYAGRDFSLYYFKDEKDHFFVETGNYIDELLLTYDYLTYWEKMGIRGYQFPTYWVHNTYKSQLIAKFSERFTRKKSALLDRTELEKTSLIRLCRSLDDL